LSQQPFSLDADQLGELARHALDTAARLGASAAETDIGLGQGLDVTVRLGEVETLEYARDRGMAITVWQGQRRGHASTSDISEAAIAETVAAALAIARHTGEDAFTGLPEPDTLAWQPAELDLCHPWPLETEAAIRLACEMEAAAMAVDARIDNSDGASVSTHVNRFVYANSLGFCHGYDSSRHSLYCSVIAGEDDSMQRDDWYTAARAAELLDAAPLVGRRAGERTVARLGARKIDTCEVPVLFEAPIAASLIGHWAGAVSGGSLYRRSSFLLESVGQAVWAPCVSIEEVPDLPRGLGSAPFDSEGVLPQRRMLVDAGVQQGYFLSTYSARKLGLRSTGNAGGPHNLLVRPGQARFDELLREMGRGLLVTELMGQGVNLVTGDYSRGASGFWVEGGRIQYPVEEITIAGNLRDIFRGVRALGSDVLVRGGRQCGSILIERMTVAGN
jgi:PmbA protein